MLKLRQRIFPDVDCEIESDDMWICSIVRKKHTDGNYYLTEVKRSIKIPPGKEQIKSVFIRQMLNEFNFMVFMYLIYSPVKPMAKNLNGAPIFVLDPNQMDDLERVCTEPE